MNKVNKTVLLLSTISLLCGCTEEPSIIETPQEPQSTAIFVGTDLHGVQSPKNIKELVQMTTQNLTETAPSVFLIGGDCAKSLTPDSVGNETFSISSVIDAIKSGCLKRHNKYFFTFGSHDSNCTDAPYTFFSGPAALNNYYLYGITFAQMSNAEDSTATQYNGLDANDAFGKSARSASTRFVRWAQSLHDNAPIVIMSHMPIHANRGDNLGGKIWCEAINEVAQSHDIFFLFGHNHTIEKDPNDKQPGDQEPPTNPDQDPEGKGGDPNNPGGEGDPNNPGGKGDPNGQGGGEGDPNNPGGEGDPNNPGEGGGGMTNAYNEQDFYLVLPGSSIPVQTAVRDVTDSLAINFTYLNAGYICNGYASKITFTDDDNNGSYDRVNIKRYTVRDTTIAYFGNTGIANPFASDLTLK